MCQKYLQSALRIPYYKYALNFLHLACFSTSHLISSSVYTIFSSLIESLFLLLLFYLAKVTMHFSTVLATLSLALGATAVSQGHSGGGVNACCLNKSTIESNGVLTGLLTRGVLKNILGTSDQACAEFHVIENLNILGKDITYLA